MNLHRPAILSAPRWCVALLLAVLVSASWASTASAADNSLSSSAPAPNSTVDTYPTTMTLSFAQPIGPSPQVTMACGDPGVVQSLSKPLLLADQTTVTVDLLAPAPKGVCTVSWRVTDTNLQPAGSGSFSFTITNDTAVTTTAPTSTTLAGATGSTVLGATTTTTVAVPVTTAVAGDGTTEGGGSSGPLGLFRLLSTLGMAMLLGGLVVIAVAWPEGVEYILTVRYLRTAWILALVSTFLFVGALTAQQTGNGLGSSLVPTAWTDALDTTSGKAAVLRFILLIAAVYVVMRPERVIDNTTQVMALGPAALAVATLAFSREEFGLIEWAAGAVHAVAMAVWLGGLLLLTRVVLAGPGDEDLVHAVRGFARISTPALIATVATGAVLLFRLDRGHLGSSHGLVLIVKTLFVSIMVFVGVAARQFINQRVARSSVMTAPLATRLRRALGIEAVVGVVVLALTAWLLALTPPGLAAGSGPSLDIQPAHQFVTPAGDVDVRVAFTERVGPNDVRIEVVKPEQAVAGLGVDFLPPAGTAGTGMTISPIPLTGAGVAVLPKSTGFTLDTAGTWTVVVRLNGSEVQRQTIYVGDPAALPTTVTTTAPTG
ncbi:MAG: copper resistance CopC/CopD family protein [Ilumatobacteraceae bacterium]